MPVNIQLEARESVNIWNDSFSAPKPSRVAGFFQLEVLDWNQIEQAKSLGAGSMDLAELEPFQSTEKSIPLFSNKHRDRERSEFAWVPFGAGFGVVHGIGTVGKEAKGLFGRRKTLENGTEALGLPPGKVSALVGSSDGPNALPVQRLRTPLYLLEIPSLLENQAYRA
ncbi:hypothetical protein FRC03_006854 [Tulasnella sp. 419]|nr:hypothetical protein FRC03_006854 [Tulasnella sp. 419]